MSRASFSLLHTTARPTGWQAAFADWCSKASPGSDIEYILTTERFYQLVTNKVCGIIPLASRVDKGSNVYGWNKAAELSSGDILITVADDFFPPESWDEKLLSAIEKAGKTKSDPFVLAPHMSRDCQLDLLTHAFLSRPYYERYGYIFHPSYTGYFSDSEFTQVAKRDGVIIPCLDLKFPHRHYAHGGLPMFQNAEGGPDAVYASRDNPEHYGPAKALYEQRLAAGFPPETV